MQLPARAIFAFNANIDHHCFPDEARLKRIGDFSPALLSQIDECFSYGVQREAQIDLPTCNFLLSETKGARRMLGGQAGNAAQQASALGVECLLHTNYPTDGLVKLFAHPGKVLLAAEAGFAQAAKAQRDCAEAHHFVFEHQESRTRFIASYDPVPPHPDALFCEAARKELPSIGKAFLGGFHLMRTPGRLGKFIEELRSWKQLNPALRLFCELGEFQSPQVRDALLPELKLFDFVGLNDSELSSFGMGLDEFAQNCNAVLFHTPERSAVFPREKGDDEALAFAETCASFRAKNGRCATMPELEGYERGFVESPVETVGLGDSFSCAYFLASE